MTSGPLSMVIGKQVMVIQGRLARDIKMYFQRVGVDPFLGSIILDSIKSELLVTGTKERLEEEMSRLDQNEEQMEMKGKE